MAADALIFDLDGTIWDSARWFALGLADGDATRAATIQAALIGDGNIVAAAKAAGLSKERLLQKAAHHGGPPPLFVGMREALDKVRARGTPLAIATNLPGSLATPMLEAAGLVAYFETVVHAGRCRIGKPNPASITMALRDLGRAPSADIFYVGDRASDAEAARRAGITPVWVAHGYEEPPADSSILTLTCDGFSAL